jgi:hypothetical protein
MLLAMSKVASISKLPSHGLSRPLALVIWLQSGPNADNDEPPSSLLRATLVDAATAGDSYVALHLQAEVTGPAMMP